MKFKMQYPPEKPIQKTYNKSIDLYGLNNLQKLLEYIDTLNLQYSDVIIKTYYEAFCDYCAPAERRGNEPSVVFSYYEKESDELFNKRLYKYNKQINKYNIWLVKNKEKIEKYNKELEETDLQKEKKKKQKEVTAIKKSIKEQEKRIKLLENK